MFRSPLSEACCAGLSDNELLLLASCRKDAGVLALLVERKRLAIIKVLEIQAGFVYDSHDYTFVTTWRTWSRTRRERPAIHQLDNAGRLFKVFGREAFACYFRHTAYKTCRIHWNFPVKLRRLQACTAPYVVVITSTSREHDCIEAHAIYLTTSRANAEAVAHIVLQCAE